MVWAREMEAKHAPRVGDVKSTVCNISWFTHLWGASSEHLIFLLACIFIGSGSLIGLLVQVLKNAFCGWKWFQNGVEFVICEDGEEDILEDVQGPLHTSIPSLRPTFSHPPSSSGTYPCLDLSRWMNSYLVPTASIRRNTTRACRAGRLGGIVGFDHAKWPRQQKYVLFPCHFVRIVSGTWHDVLYFFPCRFNYGCGKAGDMFKHSGQLLSYGSLRYRRITIQ
jgi:hypothetical protein